MIIAKLINLCFQQARQSQVVFALSRSRQCRSIQIQRNGLYAHIKRRVRENIAENVLIKERKPCAQQIKGK